MRPRIATRNDVDQISKLHVTCWHETYVGLLPDAEIARRNLQYRRQQWHKMLSDDHSTTVMIDATGFAQIGPQRDASLQAQYPRELYALYVVQSAHGTGAGQMLLNDCIARGTGGFTALVLKGNARAIAFYRKAGGMWIKDIVDTLGYTDLAFGWPNPTIVSGSIP